MHDPLVVAFGIRRPWPKSSMGGPLRRWAWEPPFVTIAGRRWYFPAIVTVWHREPGGADALSVCRYHSAWRWHVWHWHIQFDSGQRLRRWLLTRCAWCGGKSRRGDMVNCALGWDGPRGHWWRGEPGLYHNDCSTVALAHRLCLCGVPVPEHGEHGRCLVCDKFRAWRQEPDEAARLLASLPPKARITPDLRARLEPMWAARRAKKEVTDG